MFKTKTLKKVGLKTGNPALDRLMNIGDGLITLRSGSPEWLSCLTSNIVVRNHTPSTSTLYVQWVDYYKRFWSVDIDSIVKLAKASGVETDSIMDGVKFIRMFSSDCSESAENWEKIDKFSEGISLAVLDSATELYEDKNNRDKDSAGMAYSIGQFLKLCMKNDCPGIILDTSQKPVHPYLGEVSSIILDFFFRDGILANVLKHPCMVNMAVEVSMGSQPNLRSWLS